MGTSVSLEFEKPIVELEKQIDELKRLASGQQLDVEEEIAPLQKKLASLREEILVPNVAVVRAPISAPTPLAPNKNP